MTSPLLSRAKSTTAVWVRGSAIEAMFGVSHDFIDERSGPGQPIRRAKLSRKVVVYNAEDIRKHIESEVEL